jgi:HEAT repeat protein
MKRVSGFGRRLLATSLAVLGAVVTIACARDGNAQASGSRRQIVADDTASVTRLLNAVRGADPFLCELATRNVDAHGWWSRGGPPGDSPLDRDSASAMLVRWIQQDHNDPAIVPKLGAALRDPDGCVRRVAGSFLGRVSHPVATTALLGGLEDATVDTRFVSAIGLGLSERAEATQPLIRALRDEDATVRRAAAWALGALEAVSAEDALLAALQRDTDARVRQAAAWAIGRLHD